MRRGLRADGSCVPGGASRFHGGGRAHVGDSLADLDPPRIAAIRRACAAGGRRVQQPHVIPAGPVPAGRHRICHLHLRLHRSAEGRAHPASCGGEFPQFHAERAGSDAKRRASIRHHAFVRHLRSGNFPTTHHRCRNRDRHPRHHARWTTSIQRAHPPRRDRLASDTRDLEASVGSRMEREIRFENPRRRRSGSP